MRSGNRPNPFVYPVGPFEYLHEHHIDVALTPPHEFGRGYGCGQDVSMRNTDEAQMWTDSTTWLVGLGRTSTF